MNRCVEMAKIERKINCLPSFVGLYRRRDNDFIPKIVKLNVRLHSIEEKKLRRFYKCTQFDLIRKKCFATKNLKSKFLSHLYKCHPKQKFYCIYCFPAISERVEKTMYSPESLVIHMNETHKYRRFQCNQCLFRAMSADHINIHQSVIHTRLHNSSLLNKQIDGKICKIIECPAIDSSHSTPVLPKLSHFYDRFHTNRKNNDGNHDNKYQCLYCLFMSEVKREVIDHCAQRHADYPIMFYNPEPEISSTQSPSANGNSPKWLSDIDIFSKQETQENRVSSTAVDLDSDHSDNANVNNNNTNSEQKLINDDEYESISRTNKRQRISKIQNRSSANNSSQSQRLPNGSSFKSRSSTQSAALKLKKAAYGSADKSSLINISQRDGKWRPNALIRKSQTPRSRPSFSVSPPLIDLMANNASNSSLAEFSKKYICLICDGNHSEMKLQGISSHLYMYHNTCKIKPSDQPFCCAHCKDFCGTEAEVVCHSRLCQKKTNDKSQNAFVFIVPKDEYETRNKPNVQIEDEDNYYISDSSEDEKLINSNRSATNEYNDKKINQMNPQIIRDHKSKADTHFDDTGCSEMRTETNKSKDKTKDQMKTTTIEVAMPESDEDIEMQVKPMFVCFFCDITSIDRESAKAHLETHFPDIDRAVDDYQITKPVHKWVKTFIDKQDSLFEKMCDFNDMNHCDDSNDLNVEHRYQCPICVKIANLKNVRAKRYKYFWELRNHYWDHSFWLPVKCNICKPNHDLPNCDHTIVRHLNTKHNDKLIASDNQFVKTMTGNKMKSCCTSQQRSALEQSLITYSRYQLLDSHIENTLKLISEKQELKLRLINNCPQELPEVKLIRLPPINYDDVYVVRKYLKRVNTIHNSEQRLKASNSNKSNSNKSNSNKVHEEIQLGSSSEDSEHQFPIIRRKKAKPAYNLLFGDENCDEPNDALNDEFSDCELLTDTNCHSEKEFTYESQNNDKQNEISVNVSTSNRTITSNDSSIESSNKCLEENIIVDNRKSQMMDNTEVSIVKYESEPSTSYRESATTTPSSPNENMSSTKKLVCSECNKLFDNRSEIREHYSVEHSGLTIRFTRTIT